MRAAACSALLLALAAAAGCEPEYRPMEAFTSKDGNFACVFPGGAASWRMKGWSFPPIHVAEARNPGGIAYAAGYGDMVHGPPRAADLPRMYADMREKVAAEFKSTVLGHTEVWVEGYKGTEFTLQLPPPDGRVSRMRAFVAGKRVYMYGLVAPKGEAHGGDALKFMTSFRLLEKPPAEKAK